MAKISEKYTQIVEKWLVGGLTLDRMNLTPDQKLRTRLCYEAYQIWMQDKQIRPAELLRNLANREYPILLHKAAEGDEKAQEIIKRCNITPGKTRTVTEISNDVALLNWLIGRFNKPTQFIERAKVEDASDWLIREGKKMGNDRAVAKGAQIKMDLYDSFREKEDAQDQMPDTGINITGDVSIIKSDRVNYSEEEKRALAKKLGVTITEFQELVQQEDGSWAIDKDREDDDDAYIDPITIED